MVRDNEVSEARAAHRRRLAAARRPMRSGDEDSSTVRKHRQAHRWNISHEEVSEKRAVPIFPPYKNQVPLLWGENDEDK